MSTLLCSRQGVIGCLYFLLVVFRSFKQLRVPLDSINCNLNLYNLVILLSRSSLQFPIFGFRKEIVDVVARAGRNLGSADPRGPVPSVQLPSPSDISLFHLQGPTFTYFNISFKFQYSKVTIYEVITREKNFFFKDVLRIKKKCQVFSLP